MGRFLDESPDISCCGAPHNCVDDYQGSTTRFKYFGAGGDQRATATTATAQTQKGSKKTSDFIGPLR
jgi:hypothetical protein